MFANFKISTPDGNEHSVKGVEELKRLYREGRIAANILIRPVSSDKWIPLNEMFNLDEWEKPSANPNAVGYALPPNVDPATAYYGPGPSNRIQETPSFRGRRVAGCLTIANALLTFGMVMLRGYLPTGSRFAAVTPVVFAIICLVDLIIGLALYFGRWRPFAMVRFSLATFIFAAQILAFNTHTLRENLLSLSELIYAIGFLILLKDEFISLTRTVLGAGTVVFAEIAITVIAVVFTWPNVRSGAEARQIEKQFQPYVIKDRHFEDVEAGVMLDVPDGWLLVKKDNPITKLTIARMVVVDPRDNAYAVLRMEFIPHDMGIESAEDYVSAIEENLQKSNPDFKEVSRARTYFGNDSGIRAESAWTKDKIRHHGWRSVCKRGDVYYMLSGWCQEERQAEAFPRYKELESRFTLATFPNAK